MVLLTLLLICLLYSRSVSRIVTSATAGLMVSCSSTSSPFVRLRIKVSKLSGIMSLVIFTKKHCCRCTFENWPTFWLTIAVKSFSPVRMRYSTE